MKHLLISLLIVMSCAFCTLGVQAQAHKQVNEARVQRQTQNAVNLHAAGIRRFSYMRFYYAKNTFPEEPGFFSSPYKDMHIRALAIYFLNMQISTKMYNSSATPSHLTLNFLGVLDGLVGAPEPFDTTKATSFYQKNKKKVDAYYAQIRKESKLQLPVLSQAQINAWLKLLENLPRRGKIGLYRFAATNYLQTPIPAQEVALFRTALAKVSGSKQVVTYQTPNASLEDLDTKIGVHSQRMKYTYRWVKDECFYSAYILGKNLADQIANKTLHKHTRIYMLSAYPKTGQYLQPAEGNRFTLANGSSSLKWQYHTAILVVYPHNGSHIVMVLDNFLGGKEPISLDQWLASFHANTVFAAVPFVRNKKTEGAIKTPSKILGNDVQVNGTTYEPHPVQ